MHLDTSKDVQIALSEFHRVVKFNGILHIFVKQQQGKEKTAIVTDTLSGHERFFQWFTKAEMESLIIQSGFSIVESQDNLPDPAGRTEVKWVYCLAKNNGIIR